MSTDTGSEKSSPACEPPPPFLTAAKVAALIAKEIH